MSTDTIPHRLFKQAASQPWAPAYYEKIDGRWQATTWQTYGSLVRRAARALMALGLEHGGTVCILGFNRPEWVIMDIAAMTAGGVPAGIYTTCSASEVQYIIHHAESKVVLLENASQWKKVEAELERLPLLEHVVMMRGAEPIDHPKVMSWEAFLEKSAAIDDPRLDERLAALEPQGLATLIYTSGTTGPPKGVMLSHDNLAWTAEQACSTTNQAAGDISLSYLPLSHIAEQMFTIHGPITGGAQVYFAESLEKVPDNLREVQPTVFMGVPRIWEKFQSGIRQKLATAPKARQRIAAAAMQVGQRYHAAKLAGDKPPFWLEQAYRLADKAIYSKVKQAIGMSRARVCVTGAAPIAKEVLEFFTGLGIVVQEVYGQSEDSGPTSFNTPGRTRLGTVGPAFPGVEVRIAEDGEILIKGRNVFLGYFKEPEATAETLKDGWLHSGDLGEFDKDGFLKITGRKKEIIITAGGKNIAPKNIEGGLKNHPLISEAMVIGDRRKYLTALITLDPEAVARFMSEHDLVGEPHARAEVRGEIQGAVDAVNRELARVETVKKFTILPRPFSVETGELTPSLKLKRNVVNKHYTTEIESMYAEE